jgi:hypothetical protein
MHQLPPPLHIGTHSSTGSSITSSDEARIANFFRPARHPHHLQLVNDVTSVQTYSEYSRRRGMTDIADHTISMPVYMHRVHPSVVPSHAREYDVNDMDGSTVVDGHGRDSHGSNSPDGGLPMVYAHRDLVRILIHDDPVTLPPLARTSGERTRRTTVSGGAFVGRQGMRYTHQGLLQDGTICESLPASSNASMIIGSVRSRIGLEERIRANSNRDTDVVPVT